MTTNSSARKGLPLVSFGGYLPDQMEQVGDNSLLKRFSVPTRKALAFLSGSRANRTSSGKGRVADNPGAIS